MTEESDPSGAPHTTLAALDQLPAVIWVFSGPDHVAVLANRAGREYRGGSRMHLMGRPLRESLATENRPLVDLLDEVYASGRTLTYYETEIHIDGAERFVTFTAVPLRDDAGAVTGVLAHMTDVTDSVRERRRAERALASEHEILLALQDRLLPSGLPLLPGVRVAARYRSAGEHLDAGGDWYDAVPLDGGQVGVSVGDVVGNGPGAAALMGQLRGALTAAMLASPDPAVALAHLERFVATVPGAKGSTACAAVLDPADGVLRYASAGHPPPVLVRADGVAELLAVEPSAPLGVAGTAPVCGQLRLDPGEAVLLYSDGAVERPGMSTERGEQRLLTACHDAWRGGPLAAAELVESVLAAVTDSPPTDDVALLVLTRPIVVVPALRVELPATPQVLARLRLRLRRWLAEVGVVEEDSVALQIASGEATANAVEHAFPDTGTVGTVVLSAELTDHSEVRIRIADTGRWRDPPAEPAGRGRGLLLMRQCTDSVELRRGSPGGGVGQGSAGTEVELVRRVRGSTVEQPDLPSGDAAGLDVPDPGISVEATESGVLAVLVGDLDASGTREVSRALRGASRGGALPLTVDTSELDYLASAGVLMLFELAAEATAAGTRLVVLSRRGSAAHHVLEFTGYSQVADLRVLDPVPDPVRG